MTGREDFSEDEWFRLRAALWQAPMGVVEVDASGTLTGGKEIEAFEAVMAGHQFREDLVGEVTRAALDGERITDDGRETPPPKATPEPTDTEGSLPDRVLEAMVAVRELLDAKAPAESEEFRLYLLELATAAAEAGREGLAGLTGPRISDDEADFLDRLRTALGL